MFVFVQASSKTLSVPYCNIIYFLKAPQVVQLFICFVSLYNLPCSYLLEGGPMYSLDRIEQSLGDYVTLTMAGIVSLFFAGTIGGLVAAKAGVSSILRPELLYAIYVRHRTETYE